MRLHRFVYRVLKTLYVDTGIVEVNTPGAVSEKNRSVAAERYNSESKLGLTDPNERTP